MAKARPRTGDTRKTNQPVKIDRLPAYVHQAILTLRNQQGMTWAEIEALSAEPFGEGKAGFINWDELPTDVLKLFPLLRLPHSNLHRWYDLRVAQVHEQVVQQSNAAREIGKLFASAVLDDANEAVVNAARDQILTLVAEGATAGERLKIANALTNLAAIQQAARSNDIKERKVSADERKIQMLERREAAAIRKMDAETEKLAKKASSGRVTKADINRIRERTFGLPPVQQAVEA